MKQINSSSSKGIFRRIAQPAKRGAFAFIAFVFLASGLAPLPLVGAAAENLIANPSVETAGTDGNPENWTPTSWGTNIASKTYATEGNTGSKSLRIDMLSRTDGDAKWMADPVSVTPGTTYSYTSYYKSSVGTEIDLQYLDASGSATYAYVQYVPTSSDWQQLTATFTVPANAVKVVVLHIVADVGWLQTDDFSLTANETPPPDEDNLIANPSMETADGALPASWQQGGWGTNTRQMTYESNGRTGSKSVSVQITQYTDGDAKWYFNSVPVVAGKVYKYRDYYKSNVSTLLVAMFTNESGGNTYETIGEVPQAADWTLAEATFTVPDGIATLSIFHLIQSVGTLQIDDVNVSVAPGQSPSTIPNNSLEQTNAAGTAPLHWQTNSWGTNNAAFEYVNEGRTGNKSVKVTLSSYTDGDGKWFFDPISTLSPGEQYRFTTWYKTNVTPHAVLLSLDANGNESYYGLPDPVPDGTANWQQYTDTFTVPQNSASVSVFLFVSENGWLQTDDYSIAEYSPSGFTRPLLSLTFDDGEEDNTSTALPMMNQRGIKSTQCFATTYIEGFQDQVDRVLQFKNSGHEICSHSATHPFLTQLSPSELTYELQHSKEYLETITGVTVRNFASPYGDYNATVNNEIDNFYRTHRTVDEGFNSKDNFDFYRLRVQNILDTTTAAEVQAWIDQAKLDKTWLILVYHRVADDPGPYDSYTNVFNEHLNVIQSSDITVKTVNDALDELVPQL